MQHTKLLASGNPIDVDPDQSELAQLDVSAYRTIRLSAGNGAGSPGPVVIAISQIDQPGTPNANAIALVDSFTLAPDESARQRRLGLLHRPSMRAAACARVKSSNVGDEAQEPAPRRSGDRPLAGH